jgi:hypothetical protein
MKADRQGAAYLRSTDWRWPVATLFLFALLVGLNPIGFRGGGADDWQYLQAARCRAESGPCLPRDHWWGRWPLVVPLSGLIALFGESRAVLALVPLAATLGCGLLIARLGNRLFGAPGGWLAAMLFLTTPIVLHEALQPSVGALELLLLLASAVLLLRTAETGQPLHAAYAGLLFGLAFQVRETSIALLPAAALVLLVMGSKRLPLLTAFALASLAPLLVELLVYGLATGDPLFRRSLSVAHSSLASSEVAVATPAGALPFFRLSLIANWEHETGVDLHWLINGPLEVLLNPKSGWTILLASLGLLVFGARLGPAQRKRAWWLLALGGTQALILIFVLSIDPKPRMMLVSLTCASLVLGALVRRAPVGALLAVLLLKLVALALGFLFEPRPSDSDAAARAWLNDLPANSVETSEATRRRLALVPEAERLPLADGTRPFLLVRTNRPCFDAKIHELAPPGTLRLQREQPLGWPEPWSGRYRALCLFAYSDPRSARLFAAVHDAENPFTEEARSPLRR